MQHRFSIKGARSETMRIPIIFQNSNLPNLKRSHSCFSNLIKKARKQILPCPFLLLLIWPIIVYCDKKWRISERYGETVII